MVHPIVASWRSAWERSGLILRLPARHEFQACGQRVHLAHEQLDWHTFDMERRAMASLRLQKIPLSSETVPLPPLAPTGVAVRADIVQAHPTQNSRHADLGKTAAGYSSIMGGHVWPRSAVVVRQVGAPWVLVPVHSRHRSAFS
jgi:hypothetical protein